jgi:hypothetical protein
LVLSGLIGLDAVLGVAETLYAEHRELLLLGPAPLLQRIVSARLLGRETGRWLDPYR